MESINEEQALESDRLLNFQNDTIYIQGPTANEKFKALGFRYSLLFSILYHIFGILTLGFIYLITHWRPDWKLYLKKSKSTLYTADTLLLKDAEGYKYVVEIELIRINGQYEQIPEDFIGILSLDKKKLKKNYDDDEVNDLLQSRRYIRYFTFHYMKFIWNFKLYKFEYIIGLENSSIGSLMEDYRGYTDKEREERQIIYGKNSLKIEVHSYFHLLFREVLNPFYIFQIASIILWSVDEYYLYASCIFIISCVSITLSLFEIRKQRESVRDMVEASNANTIFVRNTEDGGKPIEIEASSLVPGDVIVIPQQGCLMPCDALLISGNAIVNESMLTGESVPVTKTPVTRSAEFEIYSSEKHKRHTLFCGTTVIQTRYYGKAQVLAVVVRTGFATAKGELVRSILYPKPMDFKFYKDSMKFIIFLFFISVIGMSYSLYLHIIRNKPIMTTLVRTLDIVTIVVPPALPAAMTVGTYYAQSRLKKLGIFCISPPRINVCGKLKLICFDKTGTLTEDGLEVWGAIGVEENKGSDSAPLMGQPISQLHKLDPKNNFTVALATCHSLTYINRELIGDPLDLQMFNATKWTLVEPEQDSEFYDSLIPAIVRPPSLSKSQGTQGDGDSNEIKNAPELLGSGLQGSAGSIGQIIQETTPSCCNFGELVNHVVKPCTADTYVNPPSLLEIEETTFEVPYEVGIVRQFPFSSSIQRMSVIVRVLGNDHMDLYCKGAPEVVQMLCKEHTIPSNFSTVLNNFTLRGFRVIAFAHKSLKKKLSWHYAQKVKREEMENEMTFLGFLILQNVLKPETTPVIKQLKKANIRTVMVTGDNILTAICVARDCEMLDPNVKVLLAKVIEEEGKRFLVFEATQSGGYTEKSFTSVAVDTCGADCRLAVSGRVWTQIRDYFPEYIPYIVAQGTVFARMSPEQKVQLIEELQALEYIVAMCGDGANDCGALKAAHVGISLSEAEASVAAPFTSRTPNITCVPQVICEGRCALTTNFSVFKYMALYSIIQFVSILILYYACTNLSDPQFLYIDLFIVSVIAIFMGYTEANHHLVSKRPLSSLIGPINLFSVISQVVLVITAQGLAFFYLTMQRWYDPQVRCEDLDSDNFVYTWETNVIFSVSSFQYLALACIYSPGLPFRKPLYTNKCLIISITILTALTLWLAIYPTSVVAEFMSLKEYPMESPYLFRGIIIMIAFCHFIVGWIIELYVAQSKVLKKVVRAFTRKREPKNRYKRIRLMIKNDPNWPPCIGEPITSSDTR